MPTKLVYLCIWALALYASAAIQSDDYNFNKHRNILFKRRQDTTSHGAQSEQAGKKSSCCWFGDGEENGHF